ncbi:MAG: uncharacterized protein KVP18_003579 [Porospora cf. gigantea A]|nr:MAG: hypothetical protein KVP18_003579 [Porospora cf. gigantea A]
MFPSALPLVWTDEPSLTPVQHKLYRCASCQDHFSVSSSRMLAHQLQCKLPESHVHISAAPFTMPAIQPLDIEARPAEAEQDCDVFLDAARSFVVELFRCGTCYYSTPQFESLQDHSRSTGHHVKSPSGTFPGLKVAFRPQFETSADAASEPEFITTWFREQTPLDLSNAKDVTMPNEASYTAGISQDVTMPDASASAVAHDTAMTNALSNETEVLKGNTPSDIPLDEWITQLGKRHTPLLGRTAALAAVKKNPELPLCAVCSVNGSFSVLVYDGMIFRETIVPPSEDTLKSAMAVSATYLMLFYPVLDEDKFRIGVQSSWPAAWVDMKTGRPTIHLFDGAAFVEKTEGNLTKAYQEAVKFLEVARSRLLTGL